MKLGRSSRIGISIAGIAVLISGALYAVKMNSTKYSVEMNSTKYSFDKEPYVHPKIIEDLTTWASDRGEQVVAINLMESMGTNRYFGDIEVSGKESPFIYYENTTAFEKDDHPMGPPFFGYRLIGRSSSGIYVLFTESSGGGTGRFRNLLLVSLEKDKGLSHDNKNHTLRLDRERWILKKLGEINLGDRYEGDISVNGDVLHVGKDQYSQSAELFNEDTAIKIEIAR